VCTWDEKWPRRPADMAKKTRGIFLRKSAEEIEAHVARVLFDLEMPNYFKGYLYLKDAIYMAVLDENMYAPVTKDLYEKIAERYQTTSPVVEAAIRYAIRKTWKLGNHEKLHELFGAFSHLNDKKVPTNALFITRVAEEIRVDSLY
jgi:two-component system response regulator (stage 0 sporulation protein A)